MGGRGGGGGDAGRRDGEDYYMHDVIGGLMYACMCVARRISESLNF